LPYLATSQFQKDAADAIPIHPGQSALPLFMTFVGANDAHNAVAANDFAIPAHFLN